MRRAWIILDEDEEGTGFYKHEITFTEPRYHSGRVIEIVYAEIEEGEPK